MTDILTSIYRSPKKEGMYLYVNKKDELERIPEDLLKRFGKPEHAMTLLLNENRKLATAEATSVIEAIKEQGFYLQLPPTPEDYMQSLNQLNTKLYTQKSDHD